MSSGTMVADHHEQKCILCHRDIQYSFLICFLFCVGITAHVFIQQIMSFFLHVTLIYATNSMLNFFHSIVIPKYQEKTKSYNLVLIATCSRFYGFVSLFHTVSHLQGASRMRGRLGSLGSMSSFDKVSVHSEGTQNSPRKDSGNCHPSPSPLPPFFFFFF